MHPHDLLFLSNNFGRVKHQIEYTFYLHHYVQGNDNESRHQDNEMDEKQDYHLRMKFVGKSIKIRSDIHPENKQDFSKVPVYYMVESKNPM